MNKYLTLLQSIPTQVTSKNIILPHPVYTIKFQGMFMTFSRGKLSVIPLGWGAKPLRLIHLNVLIDMKKMGGQNIDIATSSGAN